MKKIKSDTERYFDVQTMKHVDWERRGSRDNSGKPLYGRGGAHKPATAYKRKPKHGDWA